MIIKRNIRNSLLPLFLSVGRNLRFISADGTIICPSGKSLQEFLAAFNQALFLADEREKAKLKVKARIKAEDDDGGC